MISSRRYINSITWCSRVASPVGNYSIEHQIPCNIRYQDQFLVFQAPYWVVRLGLYIMLSTCVVSVWFESTTVCKRNIMVEMSTKMTPVKANRNPKMYPQESHKVKTKSWATDLMKYMYLCVKNLTGVGDRFVVSRNATDVCFCHEPHWRVLSLTLPLDASGGHEQDFLWSNFWPYKAL